MVREHRRVAQLERDGPGEGFGGEVDVLEGRERTELRRESASEQRDGDADGGRGLGEEDTGWVFFFFSDFFIFLLAWKVGPNVTFCVNSLSTGHII